MKKKFPLTLKPQDAQAIIDIACDTWKERLASIWSSYIVLSKNIDIHEEDYKKMRKACTEPQNNLFDKIFGKDEEGITYSIGQRFNELGNTYILANTDLKKFV